MESNKVVEDGQNDYKNDFLQRNRTKSGKIINFVTSKKSKLKKQGSKNISNRQ